MRIPSAGGLPHSEIPGSTIARISPGLFAACHVLHRLSVPRHPPDALTLRLSATPNGKDHVQMHQKADIADQNRSVRANSPSREDTSSQDTTRRPQKTLRRGIATAAHGLPLRSHNSLLYDCQSAMHPAPATVTTSRFFAVVHRQHAPAAAALAAVRRHASRGLLRKPLSGRRSPTPRVLLARQCGAFTGGGGDRDRTDDPLLAKQVLSQLSYTPGGCAATTAPTGETDVYAERGSRQLHHRPSQFAFANRCRRDACVPQAPVVGQGGFEPPTSRLSSARSNQLSY